MSHMPVGFRPSMLKKETGPDGPAITQTFMMALGATSLCSV